MLGNDSDGVMRMYVRYSFANYVNSSMLCMPLLSRIIYSYNMGTQWSTVLGGLSEMCSSLKQLYNVYFGRLFTIKP